MKISLFALPGLALLLSIAACSVTELQTSTVTQTIQLSIPANTAAGSGEVERMQPNDDLKKASGVIKSIRMIGQKVTIVAPAGTTFDGVREVKVFIKNQSAGANPIWALIGSKTVISPAPNVIELDMTRDELKDFVLLGADITYKYTWVTTGTIPTLINLTSVNDYEITVGPDFFTIENTKIMVFSLGSTDSGSVPSSKQQFFSRFHGSLSDSLKAKMAFRDESNSAWKTFQEISGSNVRNLQQFLFDAGFMARAESIDGIFGYTTQAAARLFQEYVRTELGDSSIGVPDGTVGPNTLRHIESWRQRGLGMSDWGRSGPFSPTPEFSQWLDLLAKAKDHFQFNPSPIREKIEAFTGSTDTRKVVEWDTSPGAIHLIGLRTSQDVSARNRDNDDLFVLLINGMAFKFWGSTDPNPLEADRSDIPFLTEGQHHYKFGWHKVGDARKVYRALRPAEHGVLVFRDKNGDRALTESDIAKGLDPDTNGSINIHWSGSGRTNFSAGCQVIAGKNYINEKGVLVDCSAFAAASYDQLGSQKTRGAYNVFTDLLLAYAPSGVQTIAYTLGRDETLRLSDSLNQDFVRETVERMRRA